MGFCRVRPEILLLQREHRWELVSDAASQAQTRPSVLSPTMRGWYSPSHTSALPAACCSALPTRHGPSLRGLRLALQAPPLCLKQSVPASSVPPQQCGTPPRRNGASPFPASSFARSASEALEFSVTLSVTQLTTSYLADNVFIGKPDHLNNWCGFGPPDRTPANTKPQAHMPELVLRQAAPTGRPDDFLFQPAHRKENLKRTTLPSPQGKAISVPEDLPTPLRCQS